jgi:hypothetical protein
MRNVRVEAHGLNFGSKAEHRRYEYLLLNQKAGTISELKTQVRFELIVNGVLIGHFVCDSQYRENGKMVVEDVKANQTPLSKWQHKLMKACFGIDVRLITKETNPECWRSR